MPIQQSGSKNLYQQIPDVEDVTPIDGTIEKQGRKTMKISLISISALVFAMLLTFFGKQISSKYFRSVDVYQTSMITGDKLSSLSSFLFVSRGILVDSIGFGNSRCVDTLSTADSPEECDDPNGSGRVTIDPGVTFQKVIGFGGAFTEASAQNFFKLPEEIRQYVIDLYFGKQGIGYTLGRIHINSCDYSPSSYSFDDVEGDLALEHFDTAVTHDTMEMIPFMRQAMKASPRPIKLLASPWSPPAWMKKPVTGNGNQSMTGSAYPNGLLDDPRVKSAWASYISKFIQAYSENDVPIWALTPQNEPEFPAPWEACAYNASSELEFINDYLGPIVKTDHPHIQILAFDHNKDHLKQWAEVMMGSGGSSYVDGMAFHWYTGEDDRLLDGTYGYENVNWTYHFAPNKILLATEGCNCPGVLMDNWLRAERLGHDVIFDLLNYAQGWIDWNLLVDHQGGPNHLNNFCDAPLIAWKNFSGVHIQPKYYYFGHISKFVTPGSIRVLSEVVGDYGYRESDPNIRAGIELRMFACEKSTRQLWKLSAVNHTMGLTSIVTVVNEGHADSLINLCIGKPFLNRPYLKLSVCSQYGAKEGALQLRLTSSGQLKDLKSNYCIELVDNMREPGALLRLNRCIGAAAAQDGSSTTSHQHFYMTTKGEIKSAVRDMCLTAGWPFFTGVAFKKNELIDETVVVLMNEASLTMDYVLHDNYIDKDLRLGINGRSIQTVVY